MTRFAELKSAFTALVLLGSGGASWAEPMSFVSPEAAVSGLIAALEARDKGAVLQVFGVENEDVAFVGDADKDREIWAGFLQNYQYSNRIETPEPGRAVLHIGSEDWPFPASIVQTDGNWQFDAAGAREEVRLRRIGLNELDVIELLKAGVAVQSRYRQIDHDGDGVMAFADAIISREGERDGLYWPDEPGTPKSPIGDFMARASADGYSVDGDAKPAEPYLGYYFRILQSQGPDAPGGAYDYIVNGKMVSGFAILAYPADYDDTGIMSFMVGENGIVYESDLGVDSVTVGDGISTFNPGTGWSIVQ